MSGKSKEKAKAKEKAKTKAGKQATRTGSGGKGAQASRGAKSEPAKGAAKAIILAPGEGRDYPMGRIRAVFKADGAEVRDRYSISEWWLEPHTQGPGAHNHSEDDAFYVIEGTMSFLLGDKWMDAPKGSFVLAPGGMIHDFENRSGSRAGVLNLSFPGGFEVNMPGIADWFAEHPPGKA